MMETDLGAHLALVLSDRGSSSTLLGVRGLEGVPEVRLGEHLGSVDGLRHQHGVGGRRGGGGGRLRPGGGRVVTGAGARLLSPV